MKQFILIMSVLLGWAFQSENIYAQTGGRTLIVYFSEGGNTRGIAEEIQSQIGADLVEIEMEEPYSDSYSVLLEQAEQDLLANAVRLYAHVLRTWRRMTRYCLVIRTGMLSCRCLFIHFSSHTISMASGSSRFAATETG